ncbi:Glycosyltransferase AER61 [Macleaya cordata]|uniref:Glycosyltransferase AER61 n=1 Tax=Macleaya cordata TaxID=56857 RepID=A0A200QXY3_MACCD|nr:Glycosyltransferase AER61 [Macleaya cordata]
MERSTNDVYKPKSFTYYSTKLLVFLSLTLVLLLILFDIQALQTPLIPNSSSSSSSVSALTSWSLQQWQKVFNINNNFNYSSELEKMRSKLRDSVTFLPLKDIRFTETAMEGHTWFMSSVNDTYEDDEVEYNYFPSEASKGRLLCITGRDIHDGGKNLYGFAWPESLPASATLLDGLTYVSDTHYDYTNLFHGISAMAPFVGWYKRKGCQKPTRWVLFHWGELRTEMGSWLQKLMEATFREVKVEVFERGSGPFCFEKAVVMRHNLGRMGKDKRVEVFDLLRCKARVFCNVSLTDRAVEINGKLMPAIRLTLLMRKGARSFKNELAVIQIFQRECARVEGCKLTVAQSEDLSFCDQVRLMSSTDIVASPHGAQLTNLVFMDRNSSVMEFFPKGWLEMAGPGQYAHHWMASHSGMKHQGAWWEPLGEKECPYPEQDHHCFSFYKNGQVGHNETFFTEWSRKVINQVKISKLDQVSKSLTNEPQLNSNICSCG